MSPRRIYSARHADTARDNAFAFAGDIRAANRQEYFDGSEGSAIRNASVDGCCRLTCVLPFKNRNETVRRSDAICRAISCVTCVLAPADSTMRWHAASL